MSSIPITTKITKNESLALVPDKSTQLNHLDNELNDFYNSLNEKEQSLLKNIPTFNQDGKLTNLNKITRLFKKKANLFTINEWLEPLKILLAQANESPFKCAEMVGVNWTTVIATNNTLKKDGDNSLDDLINDCKKAFAEMIMFHPERYSGNATMAIFMAKSLAGWSDGTVNEFGVPNDRELEAILEARTALSDEVAKLDQAYHTGSIRDKEEIKKLA